MSASEITAKRAAWKASIDLDAPLKGQLPEPFMKAWHAAHVMGVSESTVYDSCKRFDACMRAGDMAGAAREVPCHLLGSTHNIPTTAFTDWWSSAGLITLRMLTREPAEEVGAA